MSDDGRARIAAQLMAMHGESQDVPAIRAALRRAWDLEWMYDLCGLVDTLGRHPEHGPFPELRQIFTDVSYSYARRRAAHAMSRVDPDS
ncbi:MAG: hypothetical protein ACKV2O_01610 [Acidimicrobiales bacterium]